MCTVDIRVKGCVCLVSLHRKRQHTYTEKERERYSTLSTGSTKQHVDRCARFDRNGFLELAPVSKLQFYSNFVNFKT